MTLDELISTVRKGKVVFKRRCTVCGASICYAMRRGEPCLISCGCRAKAVSRIVFYTWEELRLVHTDQEFKNEVANGRKR